MPLPERGQPISTDNLNEDIGADVGSELDVDYVSRVFYDLTEPHSFDEFYDVEPLDLDGNGGTTGGGGGAAGAASTITITSTNPISAPATGNTYTVTVVSDGTFFITPNKSWLTVSETSSKNNTSFTVTVGVLEGLETDPRQGAVVLQSSNAIATLTINQQGQDSSISIVRQTGAISFPYTGGENEVYKIETNPDNTITWTANIDDTTYFSHRFNNVGSYTTNNLTGTGDAFIEVKSTANDTELPKSATITVTATNLTPGGNNGPVTETITLAAAPYIAFDPPLYNFTSNQVGTSPGPGEPSGDYIIVTILSNYPLGDVDLTGTDAGFFNLVLKSTPSLSERSYYLYPTSQNTSSTTDRVANITVSVPSSPPFTSNSFTVTQRKLNVSPPIVTIEPTSVTFDSDIYFFTQLRGTITNSGGGTISSAVFALEDMIGSHFELVQEFEDNTPVETPGYARYNNPGSITTFTVSVRPSADNNTQNSITDRVRFFASNQGGTGYSNYVDITQTPPVFTFADAQVSPFYVNRDGIITPPTAGISTQIARITNIRYYNDYNASTGRFNLVTQDTTRYAEVTLIVDESAPYGNAGQEVFDILSDTQERVIEYIELDGGAIYASDIPSDGSSPSNISVDVENQIYNTTWNADVYTYVNGTNWITFINPSSGTGDGTIGVYANPNWPGLSSYRSPFREAVIRVYKNGNASISDLINIKQPAGSPPEQRPVISSRTPTGDITFEYFQSGAGNAVTLTFVRGASTSYNDITPNSVSFYMVSSHFAFYQTDSNVSVQDNGGIWVTSVTNPAASSFSVGIYPTAANTVVSAKTATVTFSMANGGGSTSEDVGVSQSGQIIWSLSPTSKSFTSGVVTHPFTLSSNLAWISSISGTAFKQSLSPTSNFTTNNLSGTGNDTIYVQSSNNSGGERVGVLTISDNSGNGQSDLTSTLTQFPGPLSGDVILNGTDVADVTDLTIVNRTSTYGAGGFPSPTYYTVAINTNYATEFTANITNGVNYAGLSMTLDNTGSGTGIDQFFGRTRTDSNTIFYINLKNNTDSFDRSVEITITYDNIVGSNFINITVKADSNTGVDPGDGGVTKPGPQQ